MQKDYQDWNPVVRGLALRTMFSLKQVNHFKSAVPYMNVFFVFVSPRLPDMMRYVSEEALQSGLKDKSAYVRKTAVLGIVKVFHADPGVVNSESVD